MTEQPLQLDRNPSPDEEAEEFSTPDERADARSKNHQLELLKQQQGPIGQLIGCTDSALTIAFILLILGAFAILGTFIGLGLKPDAFAGIIDKLITFELTVAGYVMGKKANSD